ncbi:hypothetical protein [Thalassomonas haliotis]|uniref:Type II secretion system protein M n=1 Tax=Thalassomonas haliotis TaxID=485448 RepID=A0ABY7VJN8_9GAMM|nr:hypothetical protein [Thalassomonas haliotis]WDE13271.1 hypothetical protein H3N35_07480 [Thalassomonas haliotis]
MITSGLSKAILTDKIALVTIILTLIWVVGDVQERLLSNNQQSSKVTTYPTITPLLLPLLAKDKAEQIQQKYLQYRIAPQAKVSESAGMTAEEQARQHGELTRVFAGEHELKLKAVIESVDKDGVKTSNELMALIAVKNVTTGQTTIESFLQGSQVYGFRLGIENNTQVILTNTSQQGEQKIILSMYALKEEVTN